MKSLLGFEEASIITEGKFLTVYRGKEKSTGKSIIIQIPSLAMQIANNLQFIERIFKLQQKLVHPSILEVNKIEKKDNVVYIVANDAKGIKLKDFIYQNEVTIDVFFKIAKQLIELVLHFHLKSVIMKVISPHGILINEEDDTLKFLDFSFAEKIKTSFYSIIDVADLLTIPYISPELVARNNDIVIDFRTDLYSLGVIFYEMLTQQQPINASDTSQWIHYQKAKKIKAPHLINKKVPVMLSNIVMKCLNRNLDHRYQSITSLKIDIEHSLREWEENDDINEFSLGTADISPIIKMPKKLYGREREFQRLVDSWERVRTQRTSEVVFVSALAGVGKTRLVEELKDIVKTSEGYFISGKFDQVNTEIPYVTFIKAFEQLISYVLTEEEQVIEQWREELKSVLGINSSLLVAFLKKLELIIGKQHESIQSPYIELESRFNLVICEFIRLAARLSNPLIIFLDDLQWADEASLKLMKFIMKEKIENLLLIGAYRSSQTKSLKKIIVIEDLINENPGLNITNLSLTAFHLSDIQELLSDMIGKEKSDMYFLAKHLWKKTNGNAFFLQEMIREIAQRKLIHYDIEKNCWNPNIKLIKALDFSENVIDFLIMKMKKMESQTQIVIQYAACMGASFDPSILEKITKNKVNDLYDALNEITELGLIELNKNSYTFVHDRIQQAAYSLMDSERRKITHYQIGKLMSITAEQNISENEHVYEIASHLNECHEFLQDDEEKEEIAKLNLMAGKKAMATTAFASGLNFFQNGLTLLSDDSWDSNYPLTFELHLYSLECAYLINNIKLADQLFETIINKLKINEHRLRAYVLKLMLDTKIDKADEVIQQGLKILNENGMKVKINPSKIQLLLARQRFLSYLNRFGYERLLEKPSSNDLSKELINELVLFMGPSLHVRNFTLLGLLVTKLSCYSLKNGNFSNSCGVYAGYSIIEIAYFNRTRGYEIGARALQFAEEFGHLKDKYIVNFYFAAFINHWKKPLKSSAPIFEKSIDYSILSGDLLYGGFAIAHYILSLHIRGVSLTELSQEINRFEKYKNKIKDTHYIQFIKTYKQYILALEGKTVNNVSFTDQSFQEEEFVAELEQTGMRDRKLFDYYLCKQQICFLLGHYTQGIKYSRAADQFTGSFIGIISIPEHTFYFSLLIAHQWSNMELAERTELKKQLRKNIAKFKSWAKDCPENFLDKYYMMLAEKARLSGKYNEAIHYYNQGAEAAKKNEFLQNEAIANESTAKLYIQMGMTENARIYLGLAYEKYKKIGYKTKIEQMNKHYSFLQMQGVERFFSDSNEKPQLNQILDTTAIIKATQALSGEIVLDELLKKLMNIVLQYACANRGVLILKKDDKLVIEAEGNLIGNEIITLLYQSYPFEDYVSISQSIVNYVHRTKEFVLFEVGTGLAMFMKDPYIQSKNAMAVLCIPIIAQHKCIGMIYLENHVVGGSFSYDSIEVIKTLTTQFAISIENANLYKALQILNLNLEEKVRERTEHLQKSHLAFAETLAEKAKLEERNRIAREIHDTVGHTLTTILVQIEAGKRLLSKDVELAKKNLDHSQEQVRAGLNDIRKSLQMLNEGDISNQIVPPLELFIKEVNKNMNLRIDYVFDCTNLKSQYNYVLYRALQEGITNGIRHGGANHFFCKLKTENEMIIFTLKDNGKGTNYISIGMGLSAMKERVEKLQGHFKIESSVEEGFLIVISLPV